MHAELAGEKANAETTKRELCHRLQKDISNKMVVLMLLRLGITDPHLEVHEIELRLLDHPLCRDVPRTKHMLDGLAKYRLTLGQARQDDLLGLIKDPAEMKPLNLRL